MHGVVYCKKYTRQTLRIADFGDNVTTKQEAQKILDNWRGAECPICGPLSHSELDFSGYLTVVSVHKTEEIAINEASVLNERNPNQYKWTEPAKA